MPVTVGLGAASPDPKILSTVRAVGREVDIILFSPPGTAGSFGDAATVVEAVEPEVALIEALYAGRIDAAVRGTLPASSTLKYLKQTAGVECLERIALLETADGRLFLLAPVGVDEGWTVEEKVRFVRIGRDIARSFGLAEGVAILSGGRLGDIGRHPSVDRTMADAELVARLTGAEHTEILIEEAVGRYGMVVAPDGISGNLIFRTLVFLGAGAGHGAPVVNIDRIFVDTSRASADYTNAVMLAKSLAQLKSP
ncbi:MULTISPECIES: methanogenesis marker protein Mmp4/MtxX [Methanoculleus]|uniref:Phosphotransacetylase-like protein n=2 Tax=Methanoculleus TaxID=45989 RepID=A3CTR6_METMJ|nr:MULTISPECIES: methanogenesis marker protein Mmp4/MtxX [Methanoculleus]ABN56766.1 phosphotransacetylase-like protein [Methanoculleus marisnigri JR1]MCC7556318.1 methanogenesis marker protein Mmp4/MtxX [Methanoculleus marisnigri]UYU18196.1 methanogenesis marker protein Mmp4/MtxX [Methanoculleus submarinus]